MSEPGTVPTSWTAPYELRLEAAFDPAAVAVLERMGHRVKQFPEHGLRGHVQLIRRDPTTAVLFGASDPRGDGAAMGF